MVFIKKFRIQSDCKISISIQSRGGHRSGVPESTPEGFCFFLSDPVSSDLCEISDLCENF